MRIMSRKEAWKNLKKKFVIRSAVFSAGLIPLIIIDEYIKEGYAFNPGDVTKLGTHESIIVILATYSYISFNYWLLKSRRKNGGSKV